VVRGSLAPVIGAAISDLTGETAIDKGVGFEEERIEAPGDPSVTLV
jgi:hypothetical protein